jgi:glycosyltransferase involved in cell wall biosynthesis
VQRLRKLMAEDPFDLIHAHLPPAELYVRVALLGTPAERLPLLISKHNDCAFHDRLPGERLLGRWVARRAWKVVAISEAVRRFMVGPTLGLPVAQVQTISYGIDPGPYENVPSAAVVEQRKAWGITREGEMVLGFMGRFVPQKDIRTLLRAYALFRNRFPSKLVIVGQGPLEAELRQFGMELGIPESAWHWAGFREDVPLVMNAIDVFALTSIHEGFGLVLVEAMAAGKPVVATRAGAIPEVVVDGETGYLAEPGDSAAVCAAFGKLLEPSVRARLGAAGRQRVKEKFTLDRMFAETDALYERCLAHYGKHPAATPERGRPTLAAS